MLGVFLSGQTPMLILHVYIFLICFYPVSTVHSLALVPEPKW